MTNIKKFTKKNCSVNPKTYFLLDYKHSNVTQEMLYVQIFVICCQQSFLIHRVRNDKTVMRESMASDKKSCTYGNLQKKLEGQQSRNKLI